MSDMFLSHIRIYPIKACAGTDVQEASMDERGLQYDRRWMLVNEQGKDLHQFDYPRLASVVVALEKMACRFRLLVCHRSIFLCNLSMSYSSRCTMVPGHMRGISCKYRGRCMVSRFPACAVPAGLYARARHNIPLSLDMRSTMTSQHSQASTIICLAKVLFDDLNQRLATPVSLERFRPNLVIAGAPAFAEDSWRTLEINQHTFHVVKPCDRCAITTVDAGKRSDDWQRATHNTCKISYSSSKKCFLDSIFFQQRRVYFMWATQCRL